MKVPKEIVSKLKYIGASKSEADGIKIENFVGFAKVPLGIAGPLKIKGDENTDGRFYAPLATSEATLVASCSRGCKAFSACDGLQFKVLHESMSRAPVFWFNNPNDAVRFFDLVPSLWSEFQKLAESTSPHIRLEKLTPHVVGSTVHIIFEYHCGEGAGQNMVTIATQHVCNVFHNSVRAREMNIQNITIEGQMTAEKSLSWGNIMRTRGVRALAWGCLSNPVCLKALGCSTEALYRVFTNAREGAGRNGQLGFSINAVNIVAAMFIACGQDTASVAEASGNHLTVEYDSLTKELKLSLYFPSLPVGAIGGGTIYPTQKEALAMLECTGPGGKRRLAGLIACFALALEISTTAAVTNGTFAASHQKYGRGRQTVSPPKL